jgi:GNAT superfamily N-acetyltransferase
MIRFATRNDFEQAVVLGWEMHQQSPRYSKMNYNLEKVVMFFESIINNDDYLFLVAEKEGRLVGGFIGYVMPTWFGDDLTAGDFSLFIHQDHRGGTTAPRLIKKYIAWAKAKGVKAENIGLGITTGVDPEKTAKLYEMLNFQESGILMNLKGGA